MARRKDPVPKPFLKWVGGKRQILPKLTELFPVEFDRFYEPFVGGGAVFFHLLPQKASISDANQELINCYLVVRDRVEELIPSLKKHVYDKEYYYSVREIDPESLSAVERASRTIFLNRAGFNGLYRVNSQGKFNVPFGRYTNPTFCDEVNLRVCSRAIRGKTVSCSSFENALSSAKRGDFAYLDPPYIPVSETANFTAYQRNGFGMENQEKLAEVIEELTRKGVRAMLSNADVPWIHERYREFNIRVIKANRNVNSDASRRGPVGEVVVTNYEQNSPESF